jgi:ribonuclease J
MEPKQQQPQPQRVRRNSGGQRSANKPAGSAPTGAKPAHAHRTPSNGGFKKRTNNTPKKPNYGGTKIDALRIIPIGGCEEVGRNMTIFEYQGDVIILDMGLQFPEEDMPGIDYIVPNVDYLKGREKDVKGVIFSHGHLDHIGAAPVLLEKLGNPTILGRDLTLAMIKHKVEDYRKGSAKKLKAIRINSIDQVFTLGKFTVKFFQVEHSIMDAVGVIVETPEGSVIHPGDWTLDRDKEGKATLDYSHLQNVKQPSMLMLESLGVLHDHRGVSYEDMYKNLQDIIRQAPGRVIIGTFSSQIERVKWVLAAAESMGKKVFLDGYSMRTNIEMATKLGYIKMKKGVLEDMRKVEKFNDNQVVVLCTGAQGEENAVLSRIVRGDHKSFTLKRQDTVVFSSSIIPGNERTIQRLKDNMYRKCDNVIHGQIMDVHVSGHATKTDILDVIDMVKPTYFVPVYANHFMLKETEKLAVNNGFPQDKIIVPDNGTIIDMKDGKAMVQKYKAPADYVYVDGLGVTDSQHIVLRDRQVLAEEGMVVVIVTVRAKSGELIQNPDIISRGFVFLKDNREIIETMRHKVKDMVVKSDPSSWTDSNKIRNDIRDKMGQFLFTKTKKRPMILPVVIEV